MSKILYIMRHAQAMNALTQSDAERILTATGKQQAMSVGKILKSSSIFPDLILSSTAVRAHETATRIAMQLDVDPATIRIHQSIYSGSKIDILKLINEVDSLVREVMIVGHFPTIVELYNHLANFGHIGSMDTAELRSLAFEIPWAEVSENSGTPINIPGF